MKNRSLVDYLGTFFDAPVEDIGLVSDAELESRIVGLAEVAERLHAELIHTIAEFNHRNLTTRSERLSTKARLRARCRWTAHMVSRFVHQACSLRRMPSTLRLARDGQIPPESLQILTSAERRLDEKYTSHEGSSPTQPPTSRCQNSARPWTTSNRTWHQGRDHRSSRAPAIVVHSHVPHPRRRVARRRPARPRTRGDHQ
jgi:hypothetical protein